MSAVIARHPVDSRWVSFERRGGLWEPFAVETGSLQGIITSSLQGLTGTFSWSERAVDSVRNAIALEPSDLTRPELANVSMTVLLPVREEDPTLWCMLRCLRGEIIYAGGASHFRRVNLSEEISRFFGLLGWQHIEDRVRPEYSRELLIRPTWLAMAIAPLEFQSAEEQRRKHERESVERAYEERLRNKDPRVQRERQRELDEACLRGTQEARAEAKAERKRRFGFTAAVKIRPADRTEG